VSNSNDILSGFNSWLTTSKAASPLPRFALSYDGKPLSLFAVVWTMTSGKPVQASGKFAVHGANSSLNGYRQTTSRRAAEIDYPDSRTENNVQDRAGNCRR
jgi:hypothetical protein